MTTTAPYPIQQTVPPAYPTQQTIKITENQITEKLNITNQEISAPVSTPVAPLSNLQHSANDPQAVPFISNPIDMADSEFNGPESVLRKFTKLGAVAITLGAVCLLTIITVSSSATTVDSGFVGIVKRFGAVDLDNALPEGLNWVAPFVISVHQMDTRMRAATHRSMASSKDLQTVTTEVSVQFYLNGALAPKMYQQIGTLASVESSIISPAIQESVKSVTANYAAEELITKRDAVKTQIKSKIIDFITVTLAEKEINGAVQVANVAITDFEFSIEFNRAIELKVRAEQEALQAKNEKVKRVTQAEAANAERRLEADSAAYQIKTSSEARAKAIELEAKSLKSNPELIQLRLAEKWDGRLPQVSGSAGNMLLDVNGIMNKNKGGRNRRDQLPGNLAINARLLSHDRD